MKNIKKGTLKMIIGTFLLTGVFSLVFIGVNGLAFDMARGPDRTVLDDEVSLVDEANEEQQQLLKELGITEADHELDHYVFNELIGERISSLDDGELRDLSLYYLLGVRSEVINITELDDARISVYGSTKCWGNEMGNQLIITEAATIGAGLIYEEYGINIDGAEVRLEFSTDRYGNAFWGGSVTRDGLDTSEGGWLFLSFSINDATGEKVSVMDFQLPMDELVSQTEIVLDNMQFTVWDRTWVSAASQPNYFRAPEPHHLSLEDAAQIIAEAIYEEFKISIDGVTLELMFGNDGFNNSHVTWSGGLYTGNIDLEAGVWGGWIDFSIDGISGGILRLEQFGGGDITEEIIYISEDGEEIVYIPNESLDEMVEED